MVDPSRSMNRTFGSELACVGQQIQQDLMQSNRVTKDKFVTYIEVLCECEVPLAIGECDRPNDLCDGLFEIERNVEDFLCFISNNTQSLGSKLHTSLLASSLE